ncbi:MAG: ABC transporter substrate-binding protein [Synergistaceae bacterium]|jgi:branched-chain amino acid transport system substrate-binding protein|nr:ABC transporter substrate-binding protein [Synergistaceae bacterium]
MKKFFAVGVVILSAVIMSIRAFAADTVKIGHSVSLTGGASIWGQSEARAVDLLVKKINTGGGVLGSRIEIVRYDNRADAQESVNVARRLIGDGVVAVIGPAQSGNALATGPVLERAKIPMVVTTATNTYVTVDQRTGRVKRYAFRPCFIDPFQGTVAARFAYDRLNARTVAALYDVGSDFSQWVTAYFEEAFTAKGGKVLTKEAFRSEELDYRAQLAKIKELNPDAVWLPVDQKVASIAARQARDLGITVPLLGTDNWGSPDIFDLGGDAIDGSYFVNLTDTSDPDIQDFLAEYRAEYGEEAVLPNPVMAQDALLMIAEAAKKAGSFDGPALVKGLERIADLKVTSGILTIDPTNHNPLNKPAVIQRVDVGKKEFAFVEKYQGQ